MDHISGTESTKQALIDAHMATPLPPQPPLAEEESESPSKHPSSVATVGSTIANMTAAAAAAAAAAGTNSKRFRPSVERYGSVDSSDTFLSCNTHPFPSQGSLAGLEELAAKGSMAANGSMPAVNISGINRSESETGIFRGEGNTVWILDTELLTLTFNSRKKLA